MPNPKVLQLMLPAIEKMAKSPKPPVPSFKAPAPDTWGRLMGMVKSTPEPAPNFRVSGRHVAGNVPQGLEFMLKKPGTASWGGSVAPTKGNPFELYVEGLHSSASNRVGVGDIEQGLMNYKMDIASPAQKELPLRGMKLPAGEKGRGGFRTREERYPEPEMGPRTPTAPMRDKQAAVDRLLDMARRSGFKSLSFSAEPGERPRLYEKLMGYKAHADAPEDIQSMLGRMSGRAPSAPAAPVRPPRHLMQEGMTMTPSQVENALGLSIEEAVEFGLARRGEGMYQSNLYQLTDQGRRGAIDWFGEGAGR